MKELNLHEDTFEIIEIKRNMNLAMIKVNGKGRYVQRDSIPVYRRQAYYKMRQAEDKAYGSQGQY
jgi:hypothetical protein